MLPPSSLARLAVTIHHLSGATCCAAPLMCHYLPEAQPAWGQPVLFQFSSKNFPELTPNCCDLPTRRLFPLEGWPIYFKGTLHGQGRASPLLYKVCLLTLKLSFDQNLIWLSSILSSVHLVPIFQFEPAISAVPVPREPLDGPQQFGAWTGTWRMAKGCWENAVRVELHGKSKRSLYRAPEQ